jgi:hypothetical protein
VAGLDVGAGSTGGVFGGSGFGGSACSTEGSTFLLACSAGACDPEELQPANNKVSAIVSKSVRSVMKSLSSRTS